MKNMNCIQCGEPRQLGRRVCAKCHAERANARSKRRYAEGKRTTYNHACRACSAVYVNTRKWSELCPDCLAESRIKQRTTYAYSKIAKGRLVWQHRIIAEHVLGRRLSPDEAVHHIDGDGTNNKLTNLWLLSASAHAKLHSFLNVERVVFFKHDGTEQEWRHYVRKLSFQWEKKSGEKAVLLSTLTDAEYIDEDETESVQRYKTKQTSSRKAKEEAKSARNAKLAQKRAQKRKATLKRKGKPTVQEATQCAVCAAVLTARRISYCSSECAAEGSRKVKWPSADKLRRLVWKYSVSKIARHYGVSDVAVANWCKKYGIEKPPRGYWSKQRKK